MARPTEVPRYEQSTTWATFSTDAFIDLPDVTAAYAAFLRVAAKHNAVSKGGQVSVRMTDRARDDRLVELQAAWDALDARYREVSDYASFGNPPSPPWRDSESWTIRAYAEREGYTVFDLLNPDSEVRSRALAAIKDRAV